MASTLQSLQTLRLNQALNDDMTVVPTNKLDADQYSADDLDGATEGLFGSGSVGYASLQAAQTDQLLAANLAMDQAEQGDGHAAANENFNHTPVAEDTTPRGEVQIATPGAGNAQPTDTDRALDSGVNPTGEVQAGEGGVGGSSVGAVGASQLSSGAGSFAPEGFSLNPEDGQGGAGIPGTSGTGTNGTGGGVSTVTVTETAAPPVAGQPGTNGLNGQDGLDGEGGGDTFLGDVLYDIDNTLTELGDTINNVTDVLQEITNRAGDIINNLTDLDLITEINNTVNNLTEEVNNAVTTITNSVTNILKQLPLLNDPFSLNLNSLGLLGGHLSGTFPGLLTGDYESGTQIATVDDALDFLSDQLADRTGIDALSDALSTLGGAAQQAQDAIADIANAVSGLPNAQDVSDVLNTLNAVTGSAVGLVDAAVGDALDALGLGDFGGGILDPVLDMVDGALADPASTVNDILADPAAAVDGVTDLITDLADGITSDPVGAVEDVADAVTDIVDGAAGDVLDALGLGDFGGGILDPVLEMADDVLADPVGAVEDIADMATGIVEDALADPAGAVEDVTGAAGDLIGGLLGGGGDEEGDTDLVVDTGLGIGGEELPGISEDINLDPVEGVVGDIDIDLGADGELLTGGDDSLLADAEIDMLGLDVLDGDADIPMDISEGLDGGDVAGLLGSEDGEGDGGGWTEAIAGDGEGLFGDVVDGIGGESDALPDPGGTVAEGLGVLDVDPVGGGGVTGGLFG